MESLPWFAAHRFDVFQTFGIVGGFVFTAVSVRGAQRATEIGNLIAIKDQYADIWEKLYDCPQLSRVLKKDVDLKAEPVTEQERLFVKMLILHLDTVHRASEAGLFVEIQGLQKDVCDFMSLPIPRAVWKKMEPFQEQGFVDFIESACGERLKTGAVR
ncbi:MAG: hypothetical protein ACLQVX_18760 [Limisphaerales bacterium]